MDYIIVIGNTPEHLVARVKSRIAEGYKPVGGHQAVEIHHLARYRGNQYGDTVIDREYTQSMIKE